MNKHQVKADDGTWHDVAFYVHKAQRNVVLWYDAGVCEGIGSNYQLKTNKTSSSRGACRACCVSF